MKGLRSSRVGLSEGIASSTGIRGGLDRESYVLCFYGNFLNADQ